MNVAAPRRVTRSYTQRLVAEPARVFPLLCPVREADWIEGWNPRAVYSESGVAEPDCVFITPESPADAIWYITRHEPGEGVIEMIKISPGLTACRLSIELRPAAGGAESTIRYSHTSLGPAGDTFIAAFTEEHFREFMQAWESRINHYLVHGVIMRDTAG
jgi:hypothetical protein